MITNIIINNLFISINQGSIQVPACQVVVIRVDLFLLLHFPLPVAGVVLDLVADDLLLLGNVDGLSPLLGQLIDFDGLALGGRDDSLILLVVVNPGDFAGETF